MYVVDEAATRRLVGFAASAVGMVPIHERVVEAEAQALATGRLDVLGDKIASSSLFRSAKVRELGVKEAKAFMVLASHHHVLHPGCFRELGPRPCCVRLRIEALRKLLVFGDRNALFFHRPFVPSEDAVEPKVDEHTETGFVPPLHAAIAVFHGGGCGSSSSRCGLCAKAHSKRCRGHTRRLQYTAPRKGGGSHVLIGTGPDDLAR